MGECKEERMLGGRERENEVEGRIFDGREGREDDGEEGRENNEEKEGHLKAKEGELMGRKGERMMMGKTKDT